MIKKTIFTLRFYLVSDYLFHILGSIKFILNCNTLQEWWICLNIPTPIPTSESQGRVMGWFNFRLIPGTYDDSLFFYFYNTRRFWKTMANLCFPLHRTDHLLLLVPNNRLPREAANYIKVKVVICFVHCYISIVRNKDSTKNYTDESMFE